MLTKSSNRIARNLMKLLVLTKGLTGITSELEHEIFDQRFENRFRPIFENRTRKYKNNHEKENTATYISLDPQLYPGSDMYDVIPRTL
jgi:hypothetical protein